MAAATGMIAAMAESLGTAFGRLARARPDRAAVTDDVETVTLGELDARAERWAHHLADLGVGHGDFVSIALPNGVAHYAVTIAAWKLGAIPQPVSARLPAGELAAVLDVVRPAVLVGVGPDAAPEPLRDALDVVRAVVPTGATPPGPDHPVPPAPPSPSWKAPTSGGSTGRPKVILAGEPATAESIVGRAGVYRLEPDGVVLITAPLSHNAPFLFGLLALMLGNHVVVMGRFDAARSLELAAEHAVTWFYAVPTMLRRIMLLDRPDAPLPELPALRTLFHIAAPCPPEVKRAVIAWLGPERVLEGYAGTEAQARTAITGREWLAHPGSVGRVLGGEIEARTDDGRLCAPGEVGELWLRPPPGVVTYRYLGARARSRGDGWESLGDMGWFDAEGYLYLADRRSDMIVVGGVNVYPAEVEAVLLEHPRIVSAVVVPAPDDDLGSVPHAVIQTDGTEVTDADLDAHVAERLVRAKRPRAWRRSTEPLRDDAGKVRRSLL